MAKTILIVDDSAGIRQVAGITLKGAGYEVIEAHDGVDALAKLEAHRVHLVISDVHMPGMDGIAFIQAMKARPALKYIPVIMLTTDAGELRKRQLQQTGAKTSVMKPFQPVQMLDAVAKLCLP